MIDTDYMCQPQGNCEVFNSAGYQGEWMIGCSRENGGLMKMSDLPPFLRSLLVTDGTVTKILEAYFWEPVEVVTLKQEILAAKQEIPCISVQVNDSILVREVLLRGVSSERVFAKAISVIRLDLVPERFREKLEQKQLGVGVLIRNSGLESYREILQIKSYGSNALDYNIDSAEAPITILERSYRVMINKKPSILITEKFPLNHFN